jgi:hypothetical protein
MLLANFTRSPAFLSRTPSDKDIFGNKGIDILCRFYHFD